MNFLILQTATRFLKPLLILYSIFLLFSGHNEPGGGFVGGLVASAAFALHALAYNVEVTKRLLRVDSHYLIGAGLLLAMGSGLCSLFRGAAFMTGVWKHFDVPGLGPVEIGTPLFFDMGVYLVVLGVTLTIFFHLAEE